MSTNPVTWFEVHSPNPDKAKAFYGGAFGWTFNDDMPGYSTVSLGADAPIGGGLAHISEPAYPAMTIFNVQVEDVQAACDRAIEHGGSVALPPQTMDNGLAFAYVTDPDGSTVGLWTPPEAA